MYSYIIVVPRVYWSQQNTCHKRITHVIKSSVGSCIFGVSEFQSIHRNKVPNIDQCHGRYLLYLCHHSQSGYRLVTVGGEVRG